MMKEVVPGVLGVRVISGDELLVLLRRVETGERVNLVFAEFWADATRLGEEGDDTRPAR